MRSASLLGFALLLSSCFMVLACGSVKAQASFPIKIGKTISFDSLSVENERLIIKFGSGTLSLIETESGTTGAAIVGTGTFSFRTSEGQPSLEDNITGALLRFHPNDYHVFMQPVRSRLIEEEKHKKESSALVEKYFNMLYHKKDEAIFPDPGVLGAVFQTKAGGELVINDGGAESLVAEPRTRKYLFRSKEMLLPPAFQKLSENWGNKPFHVPMTALWRREGLQASGENYYYLPLPATGNVYSQRFDPTSKFFQSWFGVYVLRHREAHPYGFDNDGQPVPRDFIQLAIADQRAWLRNAAGLRTPDVEIDTSYAVESIPTAIGGEKAWRITARIRSNADVGLDNPQDSPAYPKVPQADWTDYLNSYERVSLEVVCYIVPYEKENVTYLIYFNGVDFTDKSGQRHRTLPEISTELEAMVSSVVF